MKTVQTLELEFDNFFQGIGYTKVTEIAGSSPDYSNADYIDKEKKIIVELKVIDKDFFEEGGVIDKLSAFVTVPKNVDEKGFGQYEFSLPNENREGKIDTIEEPLRRVLKKANKQIKETKERLLNNEGIGFVMIALNMETSIHPEYFQELIGGLLLKEFSSISGFIICTPTYWGYSSQTGKYHPMCLPTTKYGCDEFIRLSCYQIGEKWCEFINNGGHPKE